MPSASSSHQPADSSLLEAILTAVAGYRDDHLLALRSARDTGVVLWHADAASASGELLGVISQAAAHQAAGSETALAAARAA